MRRGISVGGMTCAMAMACVVLLPGGLWVFGVPLPGAAKAAAIPPSLAVIQSMSELATTRVHIADVIEGSNRDYVGKWQFRGQYILGVNLAEAVYLQADAEKREAVLRLPQPHLISSKIDHESSEELYVHWASWVPLSSKQVLRDEVWKYAGRKLERLGQEQGHMERAKVQAERALTELFRGLGWNVRFEWASRVPGTEAAGVGGAAASGPAKEVSQ